MMQLVEVSWSFCVVEEVIRRREENIRVRDSDLFGFLLGLSLLYLYWIRAEIYIELLPTLCRDLCWRQCWL